MFTTFDKDGDGYLNYEESALFQWITDGNMLPPPIWQLVCAKVGCDRDKGMSLNDFRRTYLDDALAKDLDADLKADYRQFIKWRVEKAQKAQRLADERVSGGHSDKRVSAAGPPVLEMGVGTKSKNERGQ
jgi:hypothetical protein